MLYLLHKGSLSVFRWSLEARDYLETLPLLQGPGHMALSTRNDALYFTYPGGEITALPLSLLSERPLLVYTLWAQVDPATPESMVVNTATVRDSTSATSRATDRTVVRPGLILTDPFESGTLALWIDHGD